MTTRANSRRRPSPQIDAAESVGCTEPFFRVLCIVAAQTVATVRSDQTVGFKLGCRGVPTLSHRHLFSSDGQDLTRSADSMVTGFRPGVMHPDSAQHRGSAEARESHTPGGACWACMGRFKLFSDPQQGRTARHKADHLVSPTLHENTSAQQRTRWSERRIELSQTTVRAYEEGATGESDY